MTITRQRLAKHVPKSYAVNKNRHPLLDNGFWLPRYYKRFRHNADVNSRIEPLKTVIYIRFARGY
jgi:hypothetical protein